jgi:hypothetical protein
VTKPEGGLGSGSMDVRRTADPESDIRVRLFGQGNLRDGRGWGSGPMIRDNRDSF